MTNDKRLTTGPVQVPRVQELTGDFPLTVLQVSGLERGVGEVVRQDQLESAMWVRVILPTHTQTKSTT